MDMKITRRAIGYMVGLIFAVSLSTALVSTHYLDVGGFETFKYTALILLALTILFYNKITTLITLLAAAALAVWAFWLGDALTWILDEVFPFIGAAIVYMQGYGQLDPQYHVPLAIAFSAASVLVAFVSASKLRGTLFVIAVSGTLFIVMWFLGHTSIILNVAMCAAVAACIWVYRFSRHFEQSAEPEESEDESGTAADSSAGDTIKSITGKSPRGLAVCAIPLILFAAVLCVLFAPAEAYEMRSVWVQSVIDDFVDLAGIPRGFSRGTSSFSISAVGFSSPSNIGGPISLSGDTVMLVRGVSPTFLRGATRNEYTGKGWVSSESFPSYRYESALWQNKASDIFDLSRPSEEINDQPELLYRSVNLTIVPYMHLGTIFTPMRPTRLLSSDDSFVPYFNDKGEMFTKYSMRYMQSYTVQGRQVHQAGERLIGYASSISGFLAAEDDAKMEELYRLYLPGGEVDISSAQGSTPAERVAMTVARDYIGQSKYIQAGAIRDYLSENMTYTLSPSHVPEDADLVTYFLETREGYCSYFASAMAVMARAIGIPARYAEGYLLSGIKPEEGVYEVTGKNAHAWAELYFEGMGWIPFDPSPLGGSTSQQGQQGGSDPYIPELEEPTVEPAVPPVIDTEKVEEFELPGWIKALIIIAALIGVLMAAIVLHGQMYGVGRLTRLYGKRGAIEIWWREILDMLKFQDKFFIRREGETARMLAGRIGNLVYCPVATFGQIARIVERSYYSGAEPSDVETELVMMYYRRIRRNLIYRKTPFGYLFIRMLFPGLNGFRSHRDTKRVYEKKAG